MVCHIEVATKLKSRQCKVMVCAIRHGNSGGEKRSVKKNGDGSNVTLFTGKKG